MMTHHHTIAERAFLEPRPLNAPDGDLEPQPLDGSVHAAVVPRTAGQDGTLDLDLSLH